MKAIKRMVTAVVLACVLVSLSGCVGSNAVTGKLMGFNLKVVDNRYARGGVNILLAPVYGLTVLADTIIFNAIEFWSGKNPINGKPHIFDSKADTMLKINDDLDPSLIKAPIAPLSKADGVQRKVSTIEMNPVDMNTVDFNIVYSDGSQAQLRGKRDGDLVTFQMDGDVIATTTMTDLQTAFQQGS